MPGSGACACFANRSCGDNTTVEDLKCNCDANDANWREDAGFLSFKDDLPVTAFVAGDTGKDFEYMSLARLGAYHAVRPYSAEVRE